MADNDEARIIPALAGNTVILRNSAIERKDHPRSRGEYAFHLQLDVWSSGSSPLSRGIQLPPELPERPTRIIPALAGNTMNWATLKLAWRDHPRSRGEYRGCAVPLRTRLGSSPLSRGILGRQRARFLPGGIIPALAGNTLDHCQHHVTGRDHPRSRGEYEPSRVMIRHAVGSSPLSRGILDAHHGLLEGGGIIPALAGNTATTHATDVPERDHPRSRGEYYLETSPGPRIKGSSPLSRGIPSACPGTGGAAGIIPALAGNTPPYPICFPSEQDHPRSRGEYSCRRVRCSTTTGSSPLSRGILAQRHDLQRTRGIIPALAGNTIEPAGPVLPAGDHPRSRGEYSPCFFSSSFWYGSSPLSRGILSPSKPSRRRFGIIPALAGNTPITDGPLDAGRDHPRSRGEYIGSKSTAFQYLGSSPLSRGIRT